MKMLRIITAILFLLGCGEIYAQTGAVSNFCVQGAQSANVSGLPSTNKLQGVIPDCQVKVYLSGTTTLATIYANPSNGTLNNPFTANTNGQWLFYALQTGAYDVVLSGGIPPNIYTTSITLTGLLAAAGGSSGSASITVNGSGSLSSPVNFQNSSSGPGEINFTNPSGSNVQATIANPFLTLNGVTANLGSTNFLPVTCGGSSGTCPQQQINPTLGGTGAGVSTTTAPITSSQLTIPVASCFGYTFAPGNVVALDHNSEIEYAVGSGCAGTTLTLTQRGFWNNGSVTNGSQPPTAWVSGTAVIQVTQASSTSATKAPYSFQLANSAQGFINVGDVVANTVAYGGMANFFAGLTANGTVGLEGGTTSTLYNPQAIFFNTNMPPSSCGTVGPVWSMPSGNIGWAVMATNEFCTTGANLLPANAMVFTPGTTSALPTTGSTPAMTLTNTGILNLIGSGATYELNGVPFSGGGNPSIGGPGQLQMAGATTGTFAASPIDSGITNAGVTTDVLPLYVNPTDGTDQTSMVISSESESSTSAIFVVNDFNGTNTYFAVGGPVTPEVAIGTGLFVQPPSGYGTSATIFSDDDADTNPALLVESAGNLPYMKIGPTNTQLLVGSPVTSGFTQPTNSIAYSWLGSGGFYDNAFIQGSVSDTSDFYIGLNVEANGTIPSANFESAQIEFAGNGSDNTGFINFFASTTAGGVLQNVASFDPVSVNFYNTGSTIFSGSGVQLPTNSTLAGSLLCTAANAPTICPATAGISSITGPTSLVTGAVSITGSGVSQSGNAFTIGGGGSGCAEGTCVVNAPTSTQTIAEVAGITTAISSTNTSIASPMFGMTVSVDNEGPGKYNNNGPWGNTKADSTQCFSNTLGIDDCHSDNFTNMNQGDFFDHYYYELGYGGFVFGADEGGGGQKGQIFEIGYSQGFIATGTSGFINPSPVGNGSGGIVYYEAGIDGGAVVPFTGNVNTLSVNFDAAPAAGSGTIVFGVNNGGGSFTTQILVPITGITATTGTQVFTAGTNFTAFVATAGQVMGFYVASGASVSKAINAPTVGYSLAGAPATGTAAYADVGYLPGMSLTMAPVTTGSVNLPISGFGCFAHNNGCQGQSQYGWPAGAPLLDMQASSFTSTMASTSTFLGNPLTFTTTGATYPVSTAFGTIASCTGGISTVTNTWTTTSTTCNVTLSTSPASGSFTTGVVMLASNPGYIEEATVTSVGTASAGVQSVTFLAGHPWGAGAIIGQGGMAGQGLTTTASVTAGSGFWPIAFPVIMSPTSSSVMVANCFQGNCFSSFNVPSPAAAPVSGISLTRTSNVVSVTNTGFNINITPFPVGASIVISGCTVHTDLNGTFVITVNNDNNLAPVLRWAQTGADEGPDATCLKSSPQPALTFWPMAFILSSAGQSEITTEPNSVAWSTADILRAAPSSAYVMTGEDLEMGQASGGEASGSYLATDHGPSPMTYLLKLINTGGFNSPLPVSAPEAIDIEGNFQNVINIKWLPAHNGCIICITATTNPITGAFTPFYLLQDGTGGGPTILADQNNNDFTFNDLIVAPSFKGLTSASQFAAGTTINGKLPCLADGTNCPASGTGISGMTAGQVPIAATATTITSSVSASTTVNGIACALGGSCTVGTPGISGLTATQVAIAGSATTITSSIALGTSGSDIPQLSSGLLNSIVVPWGTPGTIGSGTPNTGAFTTLSTSGIATLGSSSTIGGTAVCLVSGTNCPATGSVSGGTSGFVGIFGSTTSITSGIALGTTGSDIPQLSSGLLVSSIVPWAVPGAIGSTTPNSGAFTTLTATGGIGLGSSPPTACVGLSGCGAFAEAGTAVTAAAGVDTIRSDSSHLFKVTLNGVSEFTSLMNYSISTVPALNQNTTGTAANLSGTPALPNGTTATTQSLGDNSTKLATTAFVTAALPISNAITSATGGTGISAVTCSTATCTNLRGTYTMTATAVSAGTILTLIWPTTTTAYACQVIQNGGAISLGLGHNIATATGMTISIAVTAPLTGSITIDYECQP